MSQQWSSVNAIDLLSGRKVSRIPERVGCYKVAIKPTRFNPRRHGSADVIYIGGMQPGTRSSIRKRVGLFLAAALGFGTDHSGGREFSKRRKELSLTVSDLRIAYCEFPDPLCAEAKLFREFAAIHKQDKPLLCRRRRVQGCPKHKRVC